MKFYENQYYHLYNRTNNEEALFRTRDNYYFFLTKYRYYLEKYLETIAYCLMPTHFHFLVKVREINQVKRTIHPMNSLNTHSSDDLESSDEYKNSSDEYSLQISKQIAILLRSDTRAFNKMWDRHGNLFNQKTKAKQIEDEHYYLALATYIHQNPIRSGMVEKAEDWEYSSYLDIAGYRKGSLPNKELLLSRFTLKELKELTNNKLIKREEIVFSNLPKVGNLRKV
jgi:REP element-mobilizing transposase RayT